MSTVRVASMSALLLAFVGALVWAARLVAADDLAFKRGTDAPTVRIDDMTLAGA